MKQNNSMLFERSKNFKTQPLRVRAVSLSFENSCERLLPACFHRSSSKKETARILTAFVHTVLSSSCERASPLWGFNASDVSNALLPRTCNNNCTSLNRWFSLPWAFLHSQKHSGWLVIAVFSSTGRLCVFFPCIPVLSISLAHLPAT